MNGHSSGKAKLSEVMSKKLAKPAQSRFGHSSFFETETCDYPQYRSRVARSDSLSTRWPKSTTCIWF